MTVQGRSSSSLVSSAAAGGGDEGDDGYGWGEEEGGESEPEEQDPVPIFLHIDSSVSNPHHWLIQELDQGPNKSDETHQVHARPTDSEPCPPGPTAVCPNCMMCFTCLLTLL